MNDKFNPGEWLSKSNSNNSNDQQPNKAVGKSTTTLNHLSAKLVHSIETITERIEMSETDITPTYKDWLELGFAISDALGEEGRKYYHRISRFYSDYNQIKTDEQYSNCVKSKGSGITINTFFHLAKKAGIDIFIDEHNVNNNEHNGTQLPTFPDEIYNNLPDLLNSIIKKGASQEEKALLLLGSLTVISACLPNIYGIYKRRIQYPNLYLYVTAEAGTGKGQLTLCRKLAEKIHAEFDKQYKSEYDEYLVQLYEYNSLKGEKNPLQKPELPFDKMFIIPANNSSSGMLQLLHANGEVGLIFESEGDTLTQAFKTEYGNYSDAFRKAFHHEEITSFRTTDHKKIDMKNPRLSVLLSGTPNQILTLIPNPENGLFSRFLFYKMNTNYEWEDVFAMDDEEPLDTYFEGLGDELLGFYLRLKREKEPIRFSFTSSQKDEFNKYFKTLKKQNIELLGTAIIGSIHRFGVSIFRIAMGLSTLRIMETGECLSELICSDQDFKTALNIGKILIQHTIKIYSMLPKSPEAKTRLTQNELYFNSLPPSFDRTTYLKCAEKLNINSKTAEKIIARFIDLGLILKFKHNDYKKTI